MWAKWEPDQRNDWYLICRECGEEFWVGQSCNCSEVDSEEFLDEEGAA